MEITIKLENGFETTFIVDLNKAAYYAWACVFDCFATHRGVVMEHE